MKNKIHFARGDNIYCTGEELGNNRYNHNFSKANCITCIKKRYEEYSKKKGYKYYCKQLNKIIERS